MSRINPNFDMHSNQPAEYTTATIRRLSNNTYERIKLLYGSDHDYYHHMCVKAADFITKACSEQAEVLDVDLVQRQALIEILLVHPLR